MTEFKPKDTIALSTILLIALLKYAGRDGNLDTAAALILGYYFAHRQNGSDNGV